MIKQGEEPAQPGAAVAAGGTMFGGGEEKEGLKTLFDTKHNRSHGAGLHHHTEQTERAFQ